MAGYVPEFLHRMLLDQYGQETAARIEDGYTKRRPVTLRVNTLKSSVSRVKAALDAAGIHYRPVSWSPEALVLTDAAGAGCAEVQGADAAGSVCACAGWQDAECRRGTDTAGPVVREPEIRKLPIYENGEIYLQSLSSMIPPILLEPKAGECILDMAAAPGGKTTQMAALSGGMAQITACEKNYARSERLRYNLEKQGAPKVLVMVEDARKLDSFFAFDKILLDAPCSGSGTVSAAPVVAERTCCVDESAASAAAERTCCVDESAAPAVTERTGGLRESAAPVAAERTGGLRENMASGSARQKKRPPKDTVSRELVERSARTQEALLRKALEILKPGGELIYSTCSILDAENEKILRRVLAGAKAKVVPIEHPMLGELPLLPVSIKGTVCICPTELYEGFFVAKLRKL